MSSRSLNKVMLIGRLGKDAETRFTQSGVAKTTFSVATNWRTKDPQTGEWKEQTDWHNVVLWRQENVANYLTKGTQVYIEGRLQTRNYEDKDGKKVYVTEVVGDTVFLLGSKGEAVSAGAETAHAQPQPVSAPRSARTQPAPSAPPDEAPDVISDDDVPF